MNWNTFVAPISRQLLTKLLSPGELFYLANSSLPTSHCYFHTGYRKLDRHNIESLAQVSSQPVCSASIHIIQDLCTRLDSWLSSFHPGNFPHFPLSLTRTTTNEAIRIEFYNPQGTTSETQDYPSTKTQNPMETLTTPAIPSSPDKIEAAVPGWRK